MDWLIVIASVCVAILYILIGLFIQALICGEYYCDDDMERALITIFWPCLVVGYVLYMVAKLPIALALKIREWRNK